MRLLFVAALVGGVMFAGSASAQLPSDVPGLSFDELKQTRTYYDDKGKLDPKSGGVDKGALELFAVNGKISGSKMTTSCESRYDDGKGLILYSLSGGATSGKGTCQGDSFEWTAQSSVSGGRFVLSGKGTATHSNGDRLEITQQMTVLIAGRKCTIEAYTEKIAERTVHPYLKTISTWIYETTLNPGISTCFLG